MPLLPVEGKRLGGKKKGGMGQLLSTTEKELLSLQERAEK